MLYFITALVGLNMTFAMEAKPPKATAKVSGSTLPHCVEAADEIAKIQETIKANSKTKFKYNGYRTALQSDSDHQLLARLVYAETVGANCENLNNEIATRILNVISNRIRIRGGDVKSVVFERDQFASSLNNYSESRYKDFLCPKNSGLWSKIMSQIPARLNGEAKNLADDTVHYFLYQHSPKWNKEPWSLKEDTTNTNADIQKCIKFFHNSAWK